MYNLPCIYLYCRRHIPALAELFTRNDGDFMDIKEIYEKVNLHVPLEQRRFFNHFNDTIAELEALYPQLLFEEGKHYTPMTDLSDEYIVRPLYGPAIVDNILFLSGYDKNGTFKSEFVRKAKDAYVNYWNSQAHHRHIKRARW